MYAAPSSGSTRRLLGILTFLDDLGLQYAAGSAHTQGAFTGTSTQDWLIFNEDLLVVVQCQFLLATERVLTVMEGTSACRQCLTSDGASTGGPQRLKWHRCTVPHTQPGRALLQIDAKSELLGLSQ